MKGQSLRQEAKKIIIGLTGSFGSGKTTVSKMLRSFGAQIIDADSIARITLNPNTKIYTRIIKRFGTGILKKNKTIDRVKLGELVFNNKNLLNRLNKIVHPEVIRIIKNKIKNSSSCVIVLDAPLLIEAGLTRMVDKLIVVKTEQKKQIRRIQAKFHLGKSDILKRVKAQIPLSDKVRFADFVIDNSATLQETRVQVLDIWKKLVTRPVKQQCRSH